MKRMLIAALLAVLLPVAAQADGVSPNWTGFYVGGHAGYGWADMDVSVNDGFKSQTLFPDTGSISPEGWLGGLQAGANYQTGILVFGIEADISWADLDGEHFFATKKFLDTEGKDGTSWTEAKSIEMFGSVRGRLGIAAGNKLFYGTAGWAWADVEARHTVAVDTINPHRVSNASETLNGYAVGGGVEWMLTQNLVLRGEYLYYNFGRETFGHDVGNKNGNPDITSTDLEMHVVRGGLNYKF